MDYNKSEIFNRLILLIGEDAFSKLQSSRVIVFGVGGVGSWCAESLVRSGIGHITLVDCDDVDVTNINRQLPALISTIGQGKVEVMKRRLLDINPECDIKIIQKYYNAETAQNFDLESYDYIVDAIDTLADKALLILNATSCPKTTGFVSSMGAALKMDPTKIDITEFWKVKGCPLAAALRNKFKKSKLFPKRKFKVVYSPDIFRNKGEEIINVNGSYSTSKKVAVNGSIMHTTAIFGLNLAGVIIQDLIITK